MSFHARTDCMDDAPDALSVRDWRIGRALVLGAVLCLVASGGLLWWRYGVSVFTDLVTAGMAWCM